MEIPASCNDTMFRLVCPQFSNMKVFAGEGQKQNVDDFIQAALSYYGERGELDNTPLPIALERNKDARLASSSLRFPGKLAVDAAGDRLFIADSNNNRCRMPNGVCLNA